MSYNIGGDLIALLQVAPVRIKMLCQGKLLKKYLPSIALPLIAIIVGYFSAYLAATVHSIFFVLLPLLTFALAYFSSWTGFLCGFLLFLEYTFTTLILRSGSGFGWPEMYNASEYFITAFTNGGFILVLVGSLAPVLRMVIRKRGIRNVASATVLVTLVCLIVWCGSLAWSKARTSYEYFCSIGFTSSEELSGIELYIPAGVISGAIDEEIYEYPYPNYPMSEYIMEFVDTEYGRMMMFVIPKLENEGAPYGYPSYTWHISFAQEDAPSKVLHLMPRYDVIPINKVEWSGDFFGPLKGNETKLVEQFKVPIMVKSDMDGQVDLWLEYNTRWHKPINFAYCTRGDSYQEHIEYYKIRTSDEWVFAQVEVWTHWNIEIPVMYD